MILSFGEKVRSPVPVTIPLAARNAMDSSAQLKSGGISSKGFADGSGVSVGAAVGVAVGAAVGVAEGLGTEEPPPPPPPPPELEPVTSTG